MGLKAEGMSAVQVNRAQRLSAAVGAKLVERRARILATMAERGADPGVLASEFEAQFNLLDKEMDVMQEALTLIVEGD